MKFHKNLHVVALFAAMFALNAQAASVSPAQARCAVSAWAAANGSAFANPGTALSAEPEYDTDGTTVLYYKVKMSNGGLVIASPDTDLDLVVAVLENSDGNFPKGHPLPSILKADMRNRLSVIGSSSAVPATGLLSVTAQSVSAQSATPAANLTDDVKESIRKSNAQWEKYGSSSAMRTLSLPTDEEIAPYIRRVVKGFEKGGVFTHWNQSIGIDGKPCYNYHTPNNEVCGCVATAGAAIMQFFGCSTDIGEVDGKGCMLYNQPYPCTTKPGVLDWSLLPTGSLDDVKSALLSNEAARELVGRATYNLGVLVGMSWNTAASGGSGAQTSDLAEAFKTYGFKTARHVELGSEGNASRFYKFIYSQTWANAPVAMSIQGTPGGHAVVACGYAKDPDGVEYCRVFMGWGGEADSWYNFPDVEKFNIIKGAVTMIGYEDDAVVPVCGRSNIPGAKFTIDGFEKEEPAEEEGAEPVSSPVIIESDANGYFGVRVPAALSNPVLKAVDTGKSIAIAPFNPSVLKNESAEIGKLENAMPSELLFLGLDMVTKLSVESARATALRDGKAVLMVSGSGGVREGLLLDYLTHLDSTTDLSNRFVFVHLNSSDVSSLDGDGDPTIGIFDPSIGTSEEGWHDGNGRLAYSTFIDYGSTNNQIKIEYIFDENDTSMLTNTVLAVLESGYDRYSRLHSGISVAVKAADSNSADEFAASWLPDGLGCMETGWTNEAVSVIASDGVLANCWTNGESVVFSAPAVCTNLEYGIAYSCEGCILDGRAMTNRTVTLDLSAGSTVELTWLWSIKAYRVTSGASGAPADVVEPGETWRVPGDRVTLLAKGSYKGWMLDYWEVSCTIDGSDYYGWYPKYQVLPEENGTAYSFTVWEPVHVTAVYSAYADEKASPAKYEVSVSAPLDLAGALDGDAGISVGENTTYDSCVSFAAYAVGIPDSTDGVSGVWECTGWVVDGKTNTIDTILHLDENAKTDVELVWEFKETPEEPADEPETELPEPGAISISSVGVAGDGSWRITVSGAVKDCWYWLYGSSDLSALSGDFSTWTAVKSDVSAGTNPQQATADGEVVFNVPALDGKFFWRARATSTETGEQ